MGLDKFITELRGARIIKKGEYQYILNSLTEQDPPLDPFVLEDCCNQLIRKLDLRNATKIITAEAMGISLAITISLKTGIPVVIATKRKKDIKNEIRLDYSTGYKEDVLHMNPVNKGERLIIIDDLISTAGTIIALIDGIRSCGGIVDDIGVVFNKVDYNGMKKLKKMGYNPKSLLDIKIHKGKVLVEKTK